MRNIFILLSVILNSASSFAATPAEVKIDASLVPFARGETNQKLAGVLVLMNNLGTSMREPVRYRHAEVVRFLQVSAQETKAKFDHFMNAQPNSKAHFRPYHFYYSSFVYAVSVTPEGMKMISRAPGVVKIYANNLMHNDPQVPSRRTEERRGLPYDVVDVGLDKVNAEFPQLTGAGVFLGSVDSGVDGSHPALQGKIKVYYDAVLKQRTTPTDTHGHGTHTTGTMVGTGKDGAPMGMAPGAQMISSGPLKGYDSMLGSMDFMLDPDGDPQTNDAPRAVNNSWNAGGAPDIELFYRAINVWEAASILPVFSAGNAGPRDRSITTPHEHPSAFAVASTAEDGKVASYSSRGPGVFHGQEIKKPDISAPGSNILSSTPGGRWETMSGTSMAAPHVTGATALIYQLDPKLNPPQMREILVKSSKSVDESGNPIGTKTWNKAYGMGKLDIYAAVKLVKGVVNRRNGLGLFNFGEYLNSPESLEVDAILALEKEQTVDLFQFPEPVNNANWVKASQIW